MLTASTYVAESKDFSACRSIMIVPVTHLTILTGYFFIIITVEFMRITGNTINIGNVSVIPARFMASVVWAMEHLMMRAPAQVT